MDEFEIVPSEQWQAFCATFSRSHRGWLVRLWEFHTANLEAGSADTHEIAVRDLELLEITTEQRQQHIDLRILLRDADKQVEKVIEYILSIMQERDTDGTVNGLRIDSADERSTLLRFRVPARPETVDGLAPVEIP
jgi:hypothetical protein